MDRADITEVLKRFAGIWWAVLAGLGFIVSGSASELGVTQCVEAIWLDFDEVVALARKHVPRSRTPHTYATENRGGDVWVKVLAYEIEPKNDVVQTLLCTDEPVSSQGSKRKKQYIYEIEREFSYTPVPTPAQISGMSSSGIYPPVSPDSPQSMRLRGGASPRTPQEHLFDPASLDNSRVEHLKDVLEKAHNTARARTGSSGSGSSGPVLESHNSIESDSSSPFPTAGSGAVEDGVFFVRRLHPEDDHEDFQHLKRGTSRDGREKGMICSVREILVESKPEYYNLCCVFDEVDKIPDFVALLNEPNPADEGVDRSMKPVNELVADFFSMIEKEQQYQRMMYKTGDSMFFRFHERKIDAEVVGVGTSTVVFRFNSFEGDDSDGEINQLNEILPKLAFRRIFFTSALNSMLFYFHQLAQVKFLEENFIKILPVRFLKSGVKSVVIVQPYLKPENLLEYYFKRISSGECVDEIEVLGETMTVDDFLAEVTKEIIEGVARLDKANAKHKKKDGGTGTQKIMEGFLDAKYPNYAIERDPKTNKLVLRYFDLFPAHLLLFDRTPIESNGHTQFEYFDEFYHREDGVDELVRNGMVGSYRKKYAGYSQADKMLAKMAASAIEMVFEKDSFHTARDVLFMQQSGHKYELILKIIEMINTFAALRNLTGSVDITAARNYWEARVKKNMQLRLSLDFLEVTGLMAGVDHGESSQALPASRDERILMDWARELYQGELFSFVNFARLKQLAPDTIVPYFRGMVEQYAEGEGYRSAPVRPVVRRTAGVMANPSQRPVGVKKGAPSPVFLKAPVAKRMKVFSGEVVPRRFRKTSASWSVRPRPGSFRSKTLSEVNTLSSSLMPESRPGVAIDREHGNPMDILSPLLKLQKELKEGLPQGLRDNVLLGAVLTRGLLSVDGVRAYQVGAQNKDPSSEPRVFEVVSQPLASPKPADSSDVLIPYVHKSLRRALSSIWKNLLTKGIFDWVQAEMKECGINELRKRCYLDTPPWEKDLPTNGTDENIQGVWTPGNLLWVVQQTVGQNAETSKLELHSPESEAGDEFLLQALTIAYDLKIIIDDRNGSGQVYRLETYRLRPGMWVALYQTVEAKNALDGLGSAGSPWLWLKRSYCEQGTSWELELSSFLDQAVPPAASLRSSNVVTGARLATPAFGSHASVQNTHLQTRPPMSCSLPSIVPQGSAINSQAVVTTLPNPFASPGDSNNFFLQQRERLSGSPSFTKDS